MEATQSTGIGVNPKKFLLWLFVVTIIMFFAALTSAYLVRSSDGDWLHFELPTMFWVSSGVILLSSLTMQLGYFAAAKSNVSGVITWVAATLVLGIAFLFLQVEGWGQLYQNKIYLGGQYSNPAGSFVYLLSFLHGFHLVTGLVYLIIVLVSAINKNVHAGKLLQIELCTTYWHFLDLLWIYLFVFLQVNN
ncbi:MAG: cytochrome c oxidase subunit 3 [Cytophagaceae bacterium]